MARRKIPSLSLALVLTLFPALLALSACSSAPEPKPENLPAWTQQPARSLQGDRLVYVGIGEDRNEGNAKTKAEAFGLQNVANDCSLVPKGTEITDHYGDTLGVLFRSFAKVEVSAQACQAAKADVTAARIRAAADPILALQLSRYQQTYDAPEPQESAPLDSSLAISDPASLFVVRQQLALAKQENTLSFGQSPLPAELPGATRAVSAFEQAHPEIWTGSLAFSANRPNAIDHEPLAVRDSIAERAHIKTEYQDTPPPQTQQDDGESGGGGRGKHRQPPPPPPGSPNSNMPVM